MVMRIKLLGIKLCFVKKLFVFTEQSFDGTRVVPDVTTISADTRIRDPWFESSHRQFKFSTANCNEATKIMKRGR